MTARVSASEDDGPITITLGDPEEAREAQELRGGAIVVRSKHGLRDTERLLIEALPAKPPGRLLVPLDPEGAVLIAARKLWGPSVAIQGWHLDAYVARRARATLERNGVADVEVALSPDLPGVQAPGQPAPPPVEPFDLVALPLPKTQEAALGRELVEQAHAALRAGGRLLASNDDRRADWGKRVLKEVLGNVTVAFDGRKVGLCLGARRTKAHAEVRDHRHPIAVTLRGKALALESRPGVFGHARFDQGTRALAAAADVQERDAILDLGCGYGALGIACGLAAPEGRVTLVDSNARAVALAERNCAANGLTAATALLRADLEELGDAPFDLALANPPYFANYRIARAFASTAFARLKKGGRLWMVAKNLEGHVKVVRDAGFEKVEATRAESGHALIRAIKP